MTDINFQYFVLGWLSMAVPLLTLLVYTSRENLKSEYEKAKKRLEESYRKQQIR